ncbi:MULTISPECIES: HTTM domain-containing protein [unclassified Robiginitalea]|uniref:HTTM domain-containing protein n=1 Tax=Robiginitalea TaxID=252306 RepID=UPI00234964F2|nr:MULTISPECIES: HTTM domain-containing protein [unclassified Robiginitalea]MDC6353499.1 HTTM domain-containing protein [Robiginitalea sp. PM2]MDC6373336.1 HTTM domain-containing protein [Robiginitalea sp. SP8]
MIRRLLYSRMDNSPLILFRMFYGVLLALECFGAIATGWVRRYLVEPEFTFTFIGFEWLQPLPGPGMYVYYALMGLLGIAIALGYRYRLSIILFTLLWTGTYLMQKTAYNNHYYLLILISGLMCFLPAHRARSLDAKRRPEIRTDTMYTAVKWTVVLQLFIVYTYAAIAKIYDDWLDFSFIGLLMAGKADYPLIGTILQEPWVHRCIGLFGIAFDFLIIPLLLWKPTRKWAFGASIFFHLFNSVVFQIGIFPYLSLAFTAFFFEPETIRRTFFPTKAAGQWQPPSGRPRYAGILLGVGALYFTLQVFLPIRHYAIPGDVLWTEEGHRMSWRMMLRSRRGTIQFRIVDKATGISEPVKPENYLTPRQYRKVLAYPDFIWQFAQYLKKSYALQGKDIAVYAAGNLRINRQPAAPFIDPEVDLAAEPWDHFRHHRWILPAPWELEQPE